VNRLTRYYQQQGLTIIPHNLAVPGRNCYHGMPSSYVPPPLRDYPQPGENVTMAMTFNPDVVIVSYPTNNYNSYSTAEIMTCLQTIKDSVNAMGKTCFVTSTQPRQDGSFPDLATRTRLKVLRDSIMNRFANYAIDFFTDVAVPDQYTIRPEYAFGDGIHLNDAGHRVLFQKVVAMNIFQLALPVKLLDFSIRQLPSSLQINWNVSDEVEGVGYTLQRSTNAIQFENIFDTWCTTAKNEDYQFVDAPTSEGDYYYRLLISENGRKTYSVTKKVSINSQLVLEKTVLNSSQLKIYIRSNASQQLRLQLVSPSGATIYRLEKGVKEGPVLLDIPVEKLPVGIYVIRLSSNSSQLVREIFKKN
jgi:hypothetical protein